MIERSVYEKNLLSEIERKDTLLKATYELLKKCDDSCFVEDVLSMHVVYDNADCDGFCLMNDIADDLDIEES